MSEILWQSPALGHETVRDGAERFVRETFGVGRKIVWGESPGEFRFADGYWHYRLSCEGGRWHVRRTDRLTPRARARARARRPKGDCGKDPRTGAGAVSEGGVP